MTQADTVELFGLLAAAYPKEPITEAQVALYAALLESYSVDHVREAVLRHIQQSPWFPRISEILDQMTAPNQRDPDQAWAEVQQKIRTVGYYRQPTSARDCSSGGGLGLDEFVPLHESGSGPGPFFAFLCHRSQARTASAGMGPTASGASPGLELHGLGFSGLIVLHACCVSFPGKRHGRGVYLSAGYGCGCIV